MDLTKPIYGNYNTIIICAVKSFAQNVRLSAFWIWRKGVRR